MKTIIRVYRAIRAAWWTSQRSTDLLILWPACKQYAKDIHHARAAFARHAFKDPCWRDAYSKDELMRVIGTLL